MLHGPPVILHSALDGGITSVHDNVIFYNIFPIVFLSLKGTQASSMLLELLLLTDEAFIDLLTTLPRSLSSEELASSQLTTMQPKWRPFLQFALPYPRTHI